MIFGEAVDDCTASDVAVSKESADDDVNVVVIVVAGVDAIGAVDDEDALAAGCTRRVVVADEEIHRRAPKRSILI